MSFWNTCILAYCRLGIAGLSPKAPGTAGSALAALLAPLHKAFPQEESQGNDGNGSWELPL